MTMKKTMTAALGGIAFALGLSISGAVFAQDATADAVALRAEQAELFQRMFNQPDDVDLMLEYALLSIRLQDYEAAITTLERILIYNPDQPRVKTELGAAYYRIGSYPVARQYFTEVAEDPAAPEDLKLRVTDFINEIDRRTQKSYFTGKIGANAIFTTNANNGPSSRNIEFLGVPAVLTDPNAIAQTDVGASLSAQVSHFYDLGGPNDNQWRSDFSAYSARFADTSSAAVDVLVLRTGPRLAADDDRYGLKLRPYVELDHVRYGNDALHSTLGAGLEVTNTLDPKRAIFADARLGYRDGHQPSALSDKDGINLRSRFGMTYFLDEDWTLTGFGLFSIEDAETASDRNAEFGVGGLATLRYDSGFEFAARRWQADFGVRGTYRTFSAPSLFNAPGEDRKDLDLRVSLGHTAFLEDGLAMVGKAEYFLRDSNTKTFDLDSFTVSLGVEYQF